MHAAVVRSTTLRVGMQGLQGSQCTMAAGQQDYDLACHREGTDDSMCWQSVLLKETLEAVE